MIRSRRAHRLIAGVMALGLVAAACSSDKASKETTAPTTAAGPSTSASSSGAETTTIVSSDGSLTSTTSTASHGTVGGPEQMTDATLTVGIGSDIGGLDPQSVPGTGGGNLPAYGPIFGGDGSGLLAIVDPKTSKWLPGVAQSWETATDLLTWTFHLRDNVKFHDGVQLTSTDVKFSIDRMIGKAEYNPDYVSGSRSQFEPIVDSVDAPDPLTVVVHLKKPDPILPIRPLYLVPKAYVEKVGDDGFAQDPIGIGPFKFVSWDPGNELVLERFDDFYLGWGDASGFHTPFVKKLVQKVIPDDAARLAALQAGEIDMAHNISADIAKQEESDGSTQVIYMPGTQPMYISINTNDEKAPDGSPNPWRDQRVRQAANEAVDVDTIIATILTGNERRSFGSSSTSFGFPEDLPDKAWKYDPEDAKKLLAEAGYPDGFSTTLSGPISRWPNSRPVMEAVAQYLSKVGIKADIQEMQYQEFVTRMQKRTLPGVSFFGCTGGSDPGQNFRYCYVSDGSFANGSAVDSSGQHDIAQQIDSQVAQSEAAPDSDSRAEIIGEIISEYYLNPRHIFLYEPVTPVLLTKDWSWTLRSNDLALPEYWNVKPAS
ncbi:MAG: ABC transporter substrate-binding protein [Ilumatobacteraceae bacterium]